MWLFDAHLDLAWNAIDWKRDWLASVPATRASEIGLPEPGRGLNTVGHAEMRAAGIGVCVATVLARLHRPGNPMFGYATPEAAHAVGRGQLAYYRAMERSGHIRILSGRADLAQQIANWQRAPQTTPIGVILSMEGADPIIDPDEVEDWHALGIRAIGLTHYGKNRYGGGTACLDGLEPTAKPLLANMEKLGIALDATHLSDAAFKQAMDWFGGKVLASHQNARRFVDHQRQFSDEQLRAMIGRGGVIGASFDAWMLQPNWIKGSSKPEVTMERVVDNIEHVCQLAGNTNHAGIGSDLDGGFGKDQCPADVDTIADLRRLPEILARRGFDAGEIAGIMHDNFARLFGEVLP